MEEGCPQVNKFEQVQRGHQTVKAHGFPRQGCQPQVGLQHGILKMQGLFVPFACVGSSDPVRVLRLNTTNTLDTL